MAGILSYRKEIEASKERSFNFEQKKRFKEAKKKVFSEKELSEILSTGSLKAVSFSDASYIIIDKAEKVARDFGIALYLDTKEVKNLINQQSADLDNTTSCKDIQSNISEEFGSISDAIAEMCFTAMDVAFPDFFDKEKYSLLLHFKNKHKDRANDFVNVFLRLAFHLNIKSKAIFEHSQDLLNKAVGYKSISLKTAQINHIIVILHEATKNQVNNSEEGIIELVKAIDEKVIISY